MEHALFFLPRHDTLLPHPSWLEKVKRPVLVYLGQIKFSGKNRFIVTFDDAV